MSILVPFVTVIHIILCVFIVLVVLIQQGKGAEISASFGGSSQTVFGSSGGANFFTIFTGVCAALFMTTSIFLATQGGSRNMNKSLMDGVAVPAANTAPAANSVPGATSGATNSAQGTVQKGTGTTAPGVPAVDQVAADKASHPIAPDAATQNALSPGTAMQNGAAAAPQGAPKAQH
jgi:preprotein translocase subunit SecG